jgi:hypothetical protein
MDEILLEWVIVGPLGRSIASFTRYREAEVYAHALHTISRIPCDIQRRCDFRRWERKSVIALGEVASEAGW